MARSIDITGLALSTLKVLSPVILAGLPGLAAPTLAARRLIEVFVPS